MNRVKVERTYYKSSPSPNPRIHRKPSQIEQILLNSSQIERVHKRIYCKSIQNANFIINRGKSNKFILIRVTSNELIIIRVKVPMEELDLL
jgi:hypothetical protein